MAALNAEIPDDLKKAVVKACVDRDVSLKSAVAQSLQQWLSDAAQPQAPTVATLPSIFATLTDEQRWIVQNLIEILQTQPQGAIFQSLDNTLNLAINEYRKHRKDPSANTTARQRRPDRQKGTGT